jgi:hypothetical protein
VIHGVLLISSGSSLRYGRNWDRRGAGRSCTACKKGVWLGLDSISVNSWGKDGGSPRRARGAGGNTWYAAGTSRRAESARTVVETARLSDSETKLGWKLMGRATEGVRTIPMKGAVQERRHRLALIGPIQTDFNRT